MSAFEAAISTVCEAVDFVIVNAALRKDASEFPYVPSDIPGPETYSSRVFVAVRPPGHHCGEVWLCTAFSNFRRTQTLSSRPLQALVFSTTLSLVPYTVSKFFSF